MAPVPSLDTHIEDIVRVIETEELGDVVLVGHSYAGMVITAVADRIKSRIAHLVYLDAAVPDDGDDFASHIPGTTENDAERRRTIFRSMSKDSVWLAPLPAEKAGLSKSADIEWVNRRATPHPLRTWLDPVHFQNDGHLGIPKTYILATKPMTTIMGYPAHAEIAKQGGEWTYRDIPCGHVTMVAEPELTAELLLEAGARRPARQLGEHDLQDDPRLLKRIK